MVKIITKESFSKEVIKTIQENNISAIESIIIVAGKYDLEIESAGKLVDKSLKELVQSEAIELKLLKKVDSLPI